jgi:hypothetical protein
MRFFAFIVLLSALAIAGCSAFFSIIGLKLLFVGGGVSIIVMGISLEVGKLITATFLKKKWKEISIWMRTYMLLATLLLVVITSIGIYGFLSSGYAATSVSVQGYERQIEVNTLKVQDHEKEIGLLRGRSYNESEISSIEESRKTFAAQRIALVDQRNSQIEKIRSDANSLSTKEDISLAKQVLDLAKNSLDANTTKEIDQIKLYNTRLEILDKEVQKWLDEGRGNVFRKGGLDNARETKIAQQGERNDIDVQIKKSQDRIDTLRTEYSEQVKEYNSRVKVIESNNKDQRSNADANIKLLEKENANTMTEIASYNSESDTKISTLNLKTGELTEQGKAKISEHQSEINLLRTKNEELKQSVIHTDVSTFKFIAKSLNIPLDKAVNYFIWLIIIVFDPLAVCLIIAFNVIVATDKKKEFKASVKDTESVIPTEESGVLEVPIVEAIPTPAEVTVPIELPVLKALTPLVPETKIDSPANQPSHPNHTLRDNEVYHAPTR